jgi:ribosomal protein L7/L12
MKTGPALNRINAAIEAWSQGVLSFEEVQEKPDDLNWSVLSEDIRRMVDEGKVLVAIKLHRDRTGADLAEAKRAVDEYRARKQP